MTKAQLLKHPLVELAMQGSWDIHLRGDEVKPMLFVDQTDRPLIIPLNIFPSKDAWAALIAKFRPNTSVLVMVAEAWIASGTEKEVKAVAPRDNPNSIEAVIVTVYHGTEVHQFTRQIKPDAKKWETKDSKICGGRLIDDTTAGLN